MELVCFDVGNRNGKRYRVSCEEPQKGRIFTSGTGCTGLKHGVVTAGGAECGELDFVVS